MNSSCSCCFFLLIIGNDKAFAAISLPGRHSPVLHDIPTGSIITILGYSTKKMCSRKQGEILMALTLSVCSELVSDPVGQVLL